MTLGPQCHDVPPGDFASTTTPNWTTWTDVMADMSACSVPGLRAWWKAKKGAFPRERAYPEVK